MTTFAAESGILTARANSNPDAPLLASAFRGGHGWHVTTHGGRCQIFLESEADARTVLAAVAEAVRS